MSASAVVALFALLLATSARGAPFGPAPWDADRARAMFASAGPSDSVGLAPIWSIAVRDSGRRVVVLANRFDDRTYSIPFPLDRVELRRVTARRRRSSETVLDGARAVVAVRPNGLPDSAAIHWESRLMGSVEESRQYAGVGSVPRDASDYFLSADGKYLLVLRLMPHAVNVRGETGYFGLLDYFDVSSPKHPRRIGPTLEADGPLDNGAVSADGSWIAVQILLPAEVGWAGSRVIAFERKGGRISAPRVVTPRTIAQGLMFAGKYLLVGMQYPPRPVSVEFATTDTISAYDMSPSRH